MRHLMMAVVLFAVVAATETDAQQPTGRATVMVPVGQRSTTQKPSSEAKPGQTFKECRNCPEMVILPPGLS